MQRRSQRCLTAPPSDGDNLVKRVFSVVKFSHLGSPKMRPVRSSQRRDPNRQTASAGLFDRHLAESLSDSDANSVTGISDQMPARRGRSVQRPRSSSASSDTPCRPKGILRARSGRSCSKHRRSASRVSFSNTVSVAEIKFMDLQEDHQQSGSPPPSARPRSKSCPDLDFELLNPDNMSYCSSADYDYELPAEFPAGGLVDSDSESNPYNGSDLNSDDDLPIFTRTRTRSYADEELEEEIAAHCPDFRRCDSEADGGQGLVHAT